MQCGLVVLTSPSAIFLLLLLHGVVSCSQTLPARVWLHETIVGGEALELQVKMKFGVVTEVSTFLVI